MVVLLVLRVFRTLNRNVMDSAQIIEGNKMMAEFMGGQVYEAWSIKGNPTFCWKGEMVPFFREKSHMPNVESILCEHLEFHKSWDWLMPVYRKMLDCLRSIKRPSKNHCCQGDLIEVDVACHLREADIEKTWFELLVFIQWFNKHKERHVVVELRSKADHFADMMKLSKALE